MCLLAEFEEVRRDTLMRPPSLNTVYAIIQSEETHKRVMALIQKYDLVLDF
jgi:hypothetical protein